MLFSIIIPTYNRSSTIEKVINSVLFQSYPIFEILIIDDGSSDDTEEIISRFTDKRIFYFKKSNEERAKARNFGIDKSRGGYITFLDSDDYLMPDHFRVAKSFIEKNSNPEWFHLPYAMVENGNTLFSTLKYVKKSNDELLNGNFLSCMGVFLRREVARNNYFNTDRNLSASEDHELWMRIASKYLLKMGNIITSILVQHDNRSVSVVDPSQLIIRQELFLKYVFENSDTRKFIGKNGRKVTTNSYSYISLHLALTGKYKLLSLKYLVKSLKIYPNFIFSRRFPAIVKHLLFTH